MAFVVCDSVLGGCDTAVNEVAMDIKPITNGVNNFKHNTVHSKYLKNRQGLTAHCKRVVCLAKDKITGFDAPKICA